MLDGPPTCIVVPLFQGIEAEHRITSLRSYSPVDDAGVFELRASPDILSLAAGTIDDETAAFIPLAIFLPNDARALATGARVVVRASPAFNDLEILQLRLKPRNFKCTVSLSRGLAPGGKVDFGWIPIGSHMIGRAGQPPAPLLIEHSGLLECVMGADGTITIDH